MPTARHPQARPPLLWPKRHMPGRALGLTLLAAAVLLSACDASLAAALQRARPNGQALAQASEQAPVVSATIAQPSRTPFQAASPTAPRLESSPSVTRSLATNTSTFVMVTFPATSTFPTTSTLPAISALQATSTLPGYAAADFDLAALNAGVEKISLESLKGKPVVLNFFATWCTTCRQEIPRLVHAYTQNEGKIQFIAIDLGDSMPEVKKFIREMGIPYPVLLDRQRASERSYQIRGIPTTYFLDTNGRIIDMYLGVIPEKILQQRLNQLIGR